MVAAKRGAPGDDLLSGLLELTDGEIIGIGVMLLFAGHETTANMLGLGTFALLRHQDQLRGLRADPALVDGAVEELLRYLSIVQYEVNRAALEDVEVAGRLVKRGEPLLVSIPMANRDPDRFLEPAKQDVPLRTGRGIYGVDSLPVAW